MALTTGAVQQTLSREGRRLAPCRSRLKAEDANVTEPDDERKRPQRGWSAKFGDAFRGLAVGVRGQSSFRVHLPLALLVLLAAAAVGLDVLHWAVLLLCVTLVLTAELFNSALELLAKAVTSKPDSHVGAALDVAAAAVLVASAGSALIGAIVFLSRIVELIG